MRRMRLPPPGRPKGRHPSGPESGLHPRNVGRTPAMERAPRSGTFFETDPAIAKEVEVAPDQAGTFQQVPQRPLEDLWISPTPSLPSEPAVLGQLLASKAGAASPAIRAFVRQTLAAFGHPGATHGAEELQRFWKQLHQGEDQLRQTLSAPELAAALETTVLRDPTSWQVLRETPPDRLSPLAALLVSPQFLASDGPTQLSLLWDEVSPRPTNDPGGCDAFARLRALPAFAALTPRARFPLLRAADRHGASAAVYDHLAKMVGKSWFLAMGEEDRGIAASFVAAATRRAVLAQGPAQRELLFNSLEALLTERDAFSL